MDIVAYTMKYEGKSVCSELMPIPFDEKHYNAYKEIYNDCFYKMCKALNLQPYNACASVEQLIAKKDNVFLLIVDGEVIGSVAIYGNEIDDLVVARKFQNQRCGKQLLKFAIALLQTRKADVITLASLNGTKKLFHYIKITASLFQKLKRLSYKINMLGRHLSVFTSTASFANS